MQNYNTPYDDTFRTLLNDGKRLILPVINEVFGTKYALSEEVTLSNNEGFLTGEDGSCEKRISDSSILVCGDRYHIECQSTSDGTMVIRMFEYDVILAMQDGEMVGDTYKVSFPKSAVLYLRSTRNTPDFLEVKIDVPGDSCVYKVPVIKVKEYSVDEIFEKNLWFFIPFHFFAHESKLDKIERDDERLKSLEEEYRDIMGRLEGLREKGILTAYERQQIIEMTRGVVQNLALTRTKVRERMDALMGGEILNYEAKDIYNSGVADGDKKGCVRGIAIGKEQKLVQLIELKMAKGKSVEQIADELEETPEMIRELMAKMEVGT